MSSERDLKAEEVCDNNEYNVPENTLNKLLLSNRIWGFKKGWDACASDAEAREKILLDALKIAEAQLEGTLLMISEHGRNINVPFCLEYYERCSRDAKVALQKYNQAKAGSEK